MKTVSLIFSMLTIILIIGSNNVRGQTSGIKEISQNHFVDDLGYVHVVGEVQNILSSTVDYVKANVAYYDSQNRIIGIDSAYSDPYTLSPDQSATYQVLTSPDNLASNEVSSIKVRYEYQVGDKTYQSLGQESKSTSINTPTEGNTECSKIINASITLEQDLNCNKDGLIVGKDNVIIHLNGHSIVGPGTERETVGIVVPNSDNVKVTGPGTIRNFQSGILITGSGGTNVSGLTLQGNKMAVFITGSNYVLVTKNNMHSNGIGVGAHSSDFITIRSNTLSNNDLAGTTFINTDESVVEGNGIGGSANGIFLDPGSANNKIGLNNPRGNTLDINNADGLDLSINHNEFTKNNCNTSNPVGLCE